MLKRLITPVFATVFISAGAAGSGAAASGANTLLDLSTVSSVISNSYQ